MSTTPFVIERTLQAPVSKVWEALTNKEKMKEWYFDVSDFKPEVGFEFTFMGQDEDCKEYLHRCKITDVVPEKKLRHSWQYEGYEGLSYVTFELVAEGDHTKIILTHEGLESFPALPAFARESFAAGWTAIIGTNLKDYVE